MKKQRNSNETNNNKNNSKHYSDNDKVFITTIYKRKLVCRELVFDFSLLGMKIYPPASL